MENIFYCKWKGLKREIRAYANSLIPIPNPLKSRISADRSMPFNPLSPKGSPFDE